MTSTSAAEPSAAMEESRNWLEMPPELMANILERLSIVEILNSGRKVCTSWERICKDPAMWKVINLFEEWFECDENNDLVRVTKEAVDLSCGELIDITIYDYVTDDLLEHVVQRSSKLKRLCIISCSGITNSVLSLAVKRLPHLETLHLHDTSFTPEDLELIGRNCPQLKSFLMSSVDRYSGIKDDHALAMANNMPKLRHLELYYNNITRNGLYAILNGCPRLQSLHLGDCHNLDLVGNLGKLGIEQRIKDFRYDAPSIPQIQEEYDELYEGDIHIPQIQEEYDELFEGDIHIPQIQEEYDELYEGDIHIPQIQEEYDELYEGDINDLSDGSATSEADDHDYADDSDYGDDYGHSDNDNICDYYGWYFVIALLAFLCWFAGVFCSPAAMG